MNWVVLFRLDRPALIDWLAGNVEYSPHDAFADGHSYGSAAIHYFESSLETLGPSHRDCTNQLVSKVLLHFERHFRRLVLDLVFNSQCVIDPGQHFGEFNVHHWTGNFNNFAFVHIHTRFNRQNIQINQTGRRRFPAIPE